MKKQILMISLLSALSFSAHASTGASNGPDLSGEAIPLQLDREIEVKEVLSAIEECLGEMTQTLCLNVYGRECQVLEVTEHPPILKSSPYLTPQVRLVPDESVNPSGESSYLYYQRSSWHFNFTAPNEEEGVFTWAEGVLPRFSFDPETVDVIYDSFGRVKSKRIIARNLKFHQLGTQEKIRLKNGGRPLNFFIPIGNYRRCLTRKVQGAN